MQRHFVTVSSVVDTVEPQTTITPIGADLIIVGQQSGRPLTPPPGRFDLASILKKCAKCCCAATATRIDGQGALIGRLSFRRPIQSSQRFAEIDPCRQVAGVEPRLSLIGADCALEKTLLKGLQADRDVV